MISNSPVLNLFNAIPETFKRLLRFAKDPSRHLNEAPDADLEHVLMDYLASLSIVTAVIAAFDAFLPGYLEINPISMLRMGVFWVMLTLNTITFSLFLWFFSLIVLSFSGLKFHKAIFYQGIKSYAFLNIPAAIISVIALNRIVVSGNLEAATGIADKLFSVTVAIGALALAVWLVALPLGKYLHRHYRASVAYPLGFIGCIFASMANPILASGYFSNVLDKEGFCEQFISFRKKAEIQNGSLNKDTWVGKCVASLEVSPSTKAP